MAERVHTKARWHLMTYLFQGIRLIYQNEWTVKIAMHQLIKERWMIKTVILLQELMAKLFITPSLEPCVDILREAIDCVVDTFKTDRLQALFTSYFEKMMFFLAVL